MFVCWQSLGNCNRKQQIQSATQTQTQSPRRSDYLSRGKELRKMSDLMYVLMYWEPLMGIDLWG